MATHYPGPWHADESRVWGDLISIKDGEQHRFKIADAAYHADGGRDAQAANARLIAAAPDYHESVELMIANEDVGGTGWWAAWEKVKAAHKKAIGTEDDADEPTDPDKTDLYTETPEAT